MWFTDEDLNNFDSNFKLYPPLRSKKDRNALRQGLKEGVIDGVSAMHEPMNIENKAVEFEYAAPGSVGLEAFFGILLQIFPLQECIHFLTRGRAIFGLEIPSIRKGEAANLSLFNPESKWKLSTAELHSSSKNCAFIDQPMRGRVYGTFHRNTLTQNFE